jgi:hypothetical protein
MVQKLKKKTKANNSEQRLKTKDEQQESYEISGPK